MLKDMLDTAQNRYWFGRGQHLALRLILHNNTLRELSNEAFLAGARWQFEQNAQLSPHIAKFLEMVTLLGFDDDVADSYFGRKEEKETE